MNYNNNEIITNYIKKNNLPENTILHTYGKWKQLGFLPKKGETANHRIVFNRVRNKNFCKATGYFYDQTQVEPFRNDASYTEKPYVFLERWQKIKIFDKYKNEIFDKFLKKENFSYRFVKEQNAYNYNVFVDNQNKSKILNDFLVKIGN